MIDLYVDIDWAPAVKVEGCPTAHSDPAAGEVYGTGTGRHAAIVAGVLYLHAGPFEMPAPPDTMVYVNGIAAGFTEGRRTRPPSRLAGLRAADWYRVPHCNTDVLEHARGVLADG